MRSKQGSIMPKTLLTLLLLTALPALAQSSGSNPQFHLTQTFQIGGEGSWDYLTVDPDHHLLYVPRSTHTMVLDASTGKTIADIPGQSRNHGVAIVPDLHRGFITDGKDESVTLFDTQTNKSLGKVKAATDADGIIYAPASKHLFISCGDAAAVIPVPADVDPTSGKADAPIDLGGKPEFLQSDNNGKLFVN